MISKELAQERLQSLFNPDGPAQQLARLRRLPGNLSALGQLLIHAGPEWEKLQKERNLNPDFSRRPLERLEKLSAKDRRALFEALFPGPAPFVEAAWNLFDRLPYQAGHVRRPFRNPKGRSVQARLSWLQQLAHFIQGYEKQEVTWLAAWAPHLGYFGPDALGYLFAAAVEQGGKTGGEVFDILVSSVHGTHETGMMGRHVVRGLLCSSRTDGWEIIERILLAAQREEGLRQVILESIDESHPQAFRRMLHIVVEHNLVRFSAAVRALSVWFGLPFEEVNPKEAGKILENVLRYLDSAGECVRAIQSGDAREAYYALWALAFDDVHSALPHALKLSRSPAVERRFVAIHLLSQMGLKEGLSELLHALDDEDLRIPARALASLTRWEFDADLLSESDLFERLEKLLARLKHKQTALKPLVWEWFPLSLDRETTAGRLIDCLGTRSHKRLIPYLSMMNPNDRYRVALLLHGSKQKDEETLQTLLKLAGDASPSVREQALKGLEGIALKDADVLMLEGLLARQAEDLRRGVIQLLLGLTDKKLLESAQRLIYHKGEGQRLAGLELLRAGRQKNRGGRHLRALALGYRQRGNLSEAEIRLLDEILSESVEEYSLEDALGLIDPQNRTQPVPVKSGILGGVFPRMKLGSAAAVACLLSLDALVERHRNDEIEIRRGQARGVELLGNIRWGWMFYSNMPAGGRDHSAYPLRELSESWWQSRSGELLDQDGFELMRALISAFQFVPAWTDFSRPANKALIREFQKQYDIPHDFQLNYLETVRSMVEWLIWAHPAAGETDWLLDALEESVGRIPYSELTQLDVTYGNRKIRALHHNRLACLDIARWQRDLRPEAWKDEHHARMWKIVRWLDEPKPGLTGGYATLDDALLAHQAGAATRDDLIHMFLGPPGQSRYGYAFSLLGQFTWRKLHPQLQAQVDRFPEIREIVEACRERILDVECRRGELPTAASAPAGSIRSVPGIRNLLRLLAALGDSGFERGYIHGFSRSGVFSHLIRNSYPLEGDAVEDFVGQVQAQRISERRLIELAVYAPQWADYVQRAVEWEHLSDAVWWLYAHTKDRQWVVDPEIRAEWAARIAEFTPLTADDLMDGAVDVSWFHRVYKEMGEPRWRQLYHAALYTSGGIGHTRARLFSDAMLGRLAAEQVLERILKKRHQDSVRALGLIPLPPHGDSKREILHRYEVMQEFLRTGRKFGSQRKASEKLAVSIGMQNLARTAGYADPQRLEWSMEIEAVADLSSGAIRLDLDDFQFTLAVNELGEPYLETRRNDKLVKTIPAAVRKNAAVAALLERKQHLERQVSRMRMSLEQAMCRGDEFSVSELKTLFRHPMLKNMLEQLVFICAGRLGYPVHSAGALFHHDGSELPLGDADRLRIAHPLDLLESGQWHLWQRECFVSERVQPFKQVFRELYVPTSAEKDERNLSRRYAGHQVNPRQAVALFGGRGWVVDPNEGVQKTFHDQGISARVGFLQGMFTPAEVEGLTIEAVAFTRRGAWETILLEEIPPRVFSEVMRDLDLVVSVAHAGGIDPEASASSIEARAALMRETCALLSLSNVRLSERHVIINGRLSNYNVNLGSGVVHKQPGGALCIIPVHSQHRGRIFLPFADQDPKTAEIVSKVIMLARDDQIKDPTILEQIL